jgi:SynChlorMet cassette radical SAM/SPASM protein ScmF
MPCEPEGVAAPQEDEQIRRLDLPKGVPPLRSLYLYLSGSCNLACRHCWISPTYQPAGAENGRHVKVEYVEKAVREAKPLGLRSVKLTGGEPTLHPQFREIVTGIAQEEIMIMMETNGTLIDDDLALFLRQTPGMTHISVSVDGVDAESHDALRAVPGSFERSVAGIRSLVEAGIRPQLICSLHQENVAQMGAMVALAEELGCHSIKFNYIQAMGRGESFTEEHGLDIEEVIDSHRRVEDELAKRSKIPVHYNIPYAFFSLSRLLDDRLSRCGVRGLLGMLSGGELSLCGVGVTIPELIYGHIETDSLRDVWYHSPGLIQLRELIPMQLEGICEQCLHRDICLGSCVALNYHETGKLNAPYVFCERADALGLFPASRKR